MMIKFNLSISIEKTNICKQDSVFISGSTSFLGEWNLYKAVEMKIKHDINENVPLCTATSNSTLCSIEKEPEIKQ